MDQGGLSLPGGTEKTTAGMELKPSVRQHLLDAEADFVHVGYEEERLASASHGDGEVPFLIRLRPGPGRQVAQHLLAHRSFSAAYTVAGDQRAQEAGHLLVSLAHLGDLR